MTLSNGHKEVPSHRRSASLFEIVENGSRTHDVNQHPVIYRKMILCNDNTVDG